MFGFARLRIHLLDLVVLKAEKIESFQFPGVFCCQFSKFGFGSLGGQVNTADLFSEIGGIRERVDQCELVRAVQESLLFVLTMNIQKKWGQSTQRRNRTGLVVDVNPIPFVRRNLAPDDRFFTFGVESEPVEVGFDVRFKNSFDDGSCFPRPDHFGRGFGAGEQTKGVNDDGFSGAGLAGKQVETAIEVEFELVNESKISYAKKPQHTRAL